MPIEGKHSRRVVAVTLIDHARAFGDPALLAAFTDVTAIASKVMPRFKPGRRVGFLLRACPVVRLAHDTQGHAAGAELDAFLVRAFAADDATVDRDRVYCEWLATKVAQPMTTGVTLESVRIASMARERLVRRSQGTNRAAHPLERPVVRFEGTLAVTESDRFQDWLAHGVGRHRAFGFGALILVPPGTTHASER